MSPGVSERSDQAGPRAGIVVTGTEVLTGRTSDRNGPWLSDRLRELGVDLAHIAIVGDRDRDMLAALRFFGDAGVELIITSGGLGPTEDDRTAEVVGRFQGREMVLDEALEQRIAEILRPLAKRFPNLDMDAVRTSNRKQAVIPQGATILDPVGTAPGLVVPSARGDGPTVVVLPGPPRELQPLWAEAVRTPAFRAAIVGATSYTLRTLRLIGMPESEIALTLRVARERGIDLDRLEITTCLRRGEIEVVTRYEPIDEQIYRDFAAVVRERHSRQLFSEDGATVDELVARMLRERELTVAVGESCTGGLVSARLTELAGASDYFRGGVVAYSNAAKSSLLDVDPDLIARFGAVSLEVAAALAEGACERLDADVGVGVTGIAGPGGGTEQKPVGYVCFSAFERASGRSLTRDATLPGGRADIRDRSTTVAMHVVRRLLQGEVSGAASGDALARDGASALSSGGGSGVSSEAGPSGGGSSGGVSSAASGVEGSARSS